MRPYPCPICGSRVCDSERVLDIKKLSSETSNNADLAIKCKVCKSKLAIWLSSNSQAEHHCN